MNRSFSTSPPHSSSAYKSPTVTMPSAIDSSDSPFSDCLCCNNCSLCHRNCRTASLRRFHASCNSNQNPWSAAWLSPYTFCSYKPYSGIESILNGGFDAADFVGNRRTNIVPDAGHRRRNILHHVGNGALGDFRMITYPA